MDLNDAERRLLRILADGRPIPIPDLAQRLGASWDRLRLDDLARAFIVSRVTMPPSKSLGLQITPRGQRMVHQA